MSHPPTRLVCLDLGGVLIRICRGWDEACRSAQLQLPPRLTADGETWHPLVAISREHESGAIDDVEFDHRVAAAVGMAPGQVAAAAAAWLREPYPGAVDLIRRLGRLGAVAGAGSVLSACLTNTNPRHWQAMTRPGPCFLALDHLTWRFTSFEIGRMKPEAGIYEHVERTAGARGVAPASILFFDDNAANVAAARARGWQAELIDPAVDPPARVAEHLARQGIGG